MNRLVRSATIAATAALLCAVAIMGGSVALAQSGPPELVASTLSHPGLRGAGLLGVSCVSGSLCFAEGSFDGGGFLERWNGRSWARVGIHRGLAPLGGISCTSRSFCLIVGSTGKLTFAERWNGHSLSTVRTVSPASGGMDLLASVGCVSARDCWAVGATHAATSAPRALIEHYNGHRFTLASAPPHPGYLTSISCTSARDCWAVGMFNLAEHFDGQRWRVLRLPVSFGRWDPAAVSCRAVSECWILGTSAGSRRPPEPLALRLAHGSWHRVPIPNGPPEASNFIDGMDCASSSECWAVGQSSSAAGGPGSGATETPLAEEWSGATWRIAKVTGHPGRNSYFSGVSCAAGGGCVAVGDSQSTPMVAASRPAG
jgi:hypothetical protein